MLEFKKKICIKHCMLEWNDQRESEAFVVGHAWTSAYLRLIDFWLMLIYRKDFRKNGILNLPNLEINVANMLVALR